MSNLDLERLRGLMAAAPATPARAPQTFQKNASKATMAVSADASGVPPSANAGVADAPAAPGVPPVEAAPAEARPTFGPVRRIAANGIMFIGDPHLESTKPGRRTDENYLDTALGKMREAYGIVKERGLLPVILGDLFDNPKDPNPYRVVIRLDRARQEVDGVCLLGNHGLEEDKITAETLNGVAKQFKIVEFVDQTGPWAILEIGGSNIGIGMVPYGHKIPHDIGDWFGDEKLDCRILVTHHDIGFDGAYPGATEPFEIAGCDLVVNGHMHLTKPMLTIGATRWFNPGNILRQSVDCAEHLPSVWIWTPDLWERETRLEQVILAHQKNVFDLTGVRVQADVKAVHAMGKSEFAQMIMAEAQGEGDKARSDSGDHLLEDIHPALQRRKASHGASATVLGLHQRATARLQAKP